MTLARDIALEVVKMFWADRRLNLGLVAATVLSALAGWLVPALREGALPLLLAFLYAAALAFAVLTGPRPR